MLPVGSRADDFAFADNFIFLIERNGEMALWPIFVAVFFAELGDKTQLATLLFAAEPQTNRIGVFIAASGALVLSTLIAVLVGGQLTQYVSPRIMKLVAGIGFIAIGVWALIDARG